jgi:membrane associated rhomboid family serine protease
VKSWVWQVTILAAVLGAYLTLYPRAPVLVLFPIFVFVTFFEFPAWLVILEWFVLQVVEGFAAVTSVGGGSGVAWFAHLGGFIAGLVLVRLFMLGRRTRGYQSWNGWQTQRGFRSLRGAHPPRTVYRPRRGPPFGGPWG